MSTLATIDWIGIASVLLTPITGFFSFKAGKRTRNNDFLQQLQNSIDLLAKRNSELLQELITVKGQNADMQVAMKTLSNENKLLSEGFSRLTEENQTLSKQVEFLTEQLANVKVITKVEKAPHV